MVILFKKTPFLTKVCASCTNIYNKGFYNIIEKGIDKGIKIVYNCKANINIVMFMLVGDYG